MFCPVCRSEYVSGVAGCAECHVPLVEALEDGEDTHAHRKPPAEPEVVFTSGHPEDTMIAKSILMDAGIEFGVLGEGVQDVFGWGRFPAGSNVLVGPVRIIVRPEDAAAARELLSSICDGAPASQVPCDVEAPRDFAEEPEPAASGSAHVLARRVAFIASALVLAYLAFEAALRYFGQFVFRR